MPLLLARRIHRLTHRVIATAVALSLLSMPVTYRGGADAAHAHTIFQLWEDVRIGSFTHHAPGDHRAETDYRSGADDIGSGHGAIIDRDGAGAREPVKGSPTGTVANERDGGTALAGTVGIEWDEGEPVPRTAAVGSDPDGPVASSAFTPSVRGTVLVLPATATWPQAESFVSAGRRVLRLSGIMDSPTAPPPRQAV